MTNQVNNISTDVVQTDRVSKTKRVKLYNLNNTCTSSSLVTHGEVKLQQPKQTEARNYLA